MPHLLNTSTMHTTRTAVAISTKAQLKLPMIQLSVDVITEPRLSGAIRPQPTKPVMTTAEPHSTAGSTPLRIRFTRTHPLRS